MAASGAAWCAAAPESVMETSSLRLPRFEITVQNESSLTAVFTVSSDLIWLRGHFEGLPVLPGAAELLFITALAERKGAFPGHEVRITGADSVKFTRPVTPGARLLAELSPDEAFGRIGFRITSAKDGTLFSSGTLLSDGLAEHGAFHAPPSEVPFPPRPVMDRETLSSVMAQKEPMRMADELLSYGESPDEGLVRGAASFRPVPGKCAACADGGIEPVLITESMAQAVCAVMSEWHLRRSLPVPMGMLLGVRGLRLDPDALSRTGGSEFVASAESCFFDDTRGVFSCSVSLKGRTAAEGRLTVLWLMPGALRELIGGAAGQS